MPGYAATDIFSLGANFSPQSSSTRETREFAQVLAADGDLACESSGFNVTTEYTGEYGHCGGSNGVVTDLGTVLSQFGGVEDSKIVTGVDIVMDNKSHPTVTVTGHNHANNAHAGSERTYDVAGKIGDQQGVGITLATFAAGSLTNSSITPANNTAITRITYSVSCEHMDTEDETGDHHDGQNRTCRIDLTVEGIGTEADITLGSDWATDDTEDSDANDASDTFSVTAHQYVDAS